MKMVENIVGAARCQPSCRDFNGVKGSIALGIVPFARVCKIVTEVPSGI